MIHNYSAQKVVDISLTKIAQDRSVFSPKSSLHKHLLVNQVLAKAKCALTFSSYKGLDNNKADELISWDAPQVKTALQPLNNLEFDHENAAEINHNGCSEQDDSNRDISGVIYDVEFPDENKENAHDRLCDRVINECDDPSGCESCDEDCEIIGNTQSSRNLLKRKVSCDSVTSLDCKRPKLSLVRPTYNIYEDFMDVDPQSARIGALITVFNSGFQGLLGDDAASHNELETTSLCHSMSMCSNQYRTENADYSLTATPIAMAV